MGITDGSPVAPVSSSALQLLCSERQRHIVQGEPAAIIDMCSFELIRANVHTQRPCND